jgi:hypothetical protein
MKRFLLFITIFILHQSNVLSCTCVYQSPKYQYEKADCIFIGKVIEGPIFYEDEVHYKFAANKIYKGDQSDTIIVATSKYVCPYHFIDQETYLVYAYKGDNYYTGLCTRTRRIKDAGTDLHFLDKLPQSLVSSGIAGRVYLFESNLLKVAELPPMRNYSFTLQKDSVHFLINCDYNGEFYADSIPPGNYTILPNKEMELSLIHNGSSHSSSEFQAVISDSSILERTIILAKKNAVAGTFLDENDKPVKSGIVYLIPDIYFADEKNKYQYETFDCWTDKTGLFEFVNIPDGRYYLGINILYGPHPSRPYPVTFYNNTGSRSSAQLIEVKYGSIFSDILLKVNKTLKVYNINGRIESPDSSFWRNASVELYKTAELKYNEKTASGIINRGGTFTLDILEGNQGWLSFKPAYSSASEEKGIYPVTPEPVKIDSCKNYDNIVFKIETKRKQLWKIKGRIINTDGTPFIKGYVSLFKNSDATDLLSYGSVNQETGTFEVILPEFRDGWLIVTPVWNDSGFESRWRPVKPEPFRIEAGKDYENIEIVIDPEKIELDELIKSVLLPEKTIVPETMHEKKYFLPDELNYKDYNSLKYLFKNWYVSEKIEDEERTSIYIPVKTGHTERGVLIFFPDGTFRTFLDSSYFVDLRWRMDNNSDIAIIAPNDTVMSIFKIIEIENKEPGIIGDGIWGYEIQNDKIRIRSYRYTGRKNIETTDFFIHKQKSGE